MTADQRLDQLEPLVSQTLAVADRHTAQLKQIFGVVNQLLEAGKVQSDNTQFALRELGELRQEVRTELGGLRQEVRTELSEVKHKLSATEQNQSITNTRIGDVENAVSLMGIQVANLDAKLDRILGLLDGGK
ncbi:hypothetical protein [Hymenobacter sp.]|uniref:hypothetical protein n=1 Tax=Hymenobacter sp. TaxID=1898978 RepID=UPI00286D2D92|nr:hypothetical protein [Hymenobacter sp.]